MTTQRDYTQEETIQRLKDLPPEVQRMPYSKEMGEIMMKIGNKHSLHLDQIESLQIESVAYMLGFIEPQDLNDILSKELGTTQEETVGIAKDLDDLLFLKIREAMKTADSKKNTVNQNSIPPYQPIPQEAPRELLVPSKQTGLKPYKNDPYREPIE